MTLAEALRIAGVVSCVAIASSACGGTPPPSSSLTPPSHPDATTSSTAGLATPTPATPSPASLATFPTTWERATEAPPAAVSIDLTFVTDMPRFQPATVEAAAGTITFFLRNVRYLTAPHNFRLGPELLQEQAASPDLQAGHSIVFTVESVPPGTYTFWCDISLAGAAHYEHGMVGTLTVSP